ncbi:MAG TPA: hypothetical protein VFJ99_03475, partial [Solirubrobacterales bacterium]|nr:hypothetical protein [Solirubrobacterales bacterium]
MTQTANSTTGPGRRLALCTAAAALLLLALAPGAGAKVVIDAYAPAGPSPNGTQGGLLIRQPSSQTIIPSGTSAASPNGIAVNISGNGAPAGAVYLADGWGNRIQRFDSAGAFQRAWGENVLGRDEHQTIAFGGLTSSSTGGTFTLSFDGFTTAPIAVDTLGNGELHPPLSAPSPGSIREALVKLPSIGPGGVTVAPLAGIFDGSFVVRFTGAHSGADVSQLTANGAGITGPPLTIETATLEQGSGGSFAGPEICTVAAQCQNATAAAFSGNGGQLDTPNGIAIDQSSGDVYVAEDGRISKFDADGNFLRAFGWDVVSPGAAGDVP